MEGLVVMLVVFGVFAVIFFGISQSQRATAAWATAAKKLGFHVEPGSFLSGRRMAGRLGGQNIIVDTVARGSGKSRTTYTRIRVAYPNVLGLGLRLVREGFFSGLGKAFGAQDIVVGDESFDADVIVKGTDPKKVARFLTPARRLRVHRALLAYSGLVIDDRQITCEKRGVIRDPVKLVNMVRNLTRVAMSMSGSRKEDEVVERAMTARREGRVEEALVLLGEDSARRARRAESRGKERPKRRKVRRRRAAPPPPPAAPSPAPPLEETIHADTAEEKVMAGEMLYLSGRREEARHVFEEALEHVPDDEEVRAWVERASAGAAEEKPQEKREEKPKEPAAGEPPERPSSGVSLDAAAVSEALFAAAGSSIDVNRVFDDSYKDRQVSWSGKLRAVETYFYDFVFGSDPGTKAVLEVHTVKSPLYGENTVLAVVQLPQEAAGELEAKRGEAIHIEGRLMKVDGFMRTLYLADGKVVS